MRLCAKTTDKKSLPTSGILFYARRISLYAAAIATVVAVAGGLPNLPGPVNYQSVLRKTRCGFCVISCNTKKRERSRTFVAPISGLIMAAYITKG